jgi:hypothetical protein
MAWKCHTPRAIYPALYNIICHKGDTILTVMASSPPNMTFRKDLIGPTLVVGNVLLHHLALVQLTHGIDKFKRNLHENGPFSIKSMYETLI